MELSNVTADITAPEPIQIIKNMKSADGKQRIRPNLFGIWFAVLHLHVSGEPITSATVSEVIGNGRGSCSPVLNAFAREYLLIEYRSGNYMSYVLNNEAGRKHVQQIEAQRKIKPETVKVKKDELKELRDFRSQFEGIDLEKLKELLS